MNNADWSGRYTTLTYVDPETNTNKFYRIAVLDNDTLGDHRVVYQWGRMGSNGQSSFKMYSTPDVAQNHAQQRETLKVRKGYTTYEPWTPLSEFYMSELLRLGGVNANVQGPQNVVRTEDGGVTFDEMGTLVGDLLSAAVTKKNDTIDVVVEAATMNAKFAQLREQFENIESEVEFVNTAVRSRL